MAAVLLFVAALFAGATFAATEALMPGGDTTMRFVPSGALAYVHGSDRVATEALLTSSAEMPSDVRPYEVAVFVVPGDDAPRRGIILGWRRLFGPSKEEVAALEARGAKNLDARHYLIGDEDIAASARVSSASGTSLADNEAVEPALRHARTASRLQAFVFPRLAYGKTPTDADAPTVLAGMRTLTSPEPLIIATNLHGGTYTAHVMSLSEALAVVPADPLAVRRSLSLDGVAADIAMTETSPSFDVARLFDFTPAVSEDPSETLPVATQAIAEAESAVRALFDVPYAFWLRLRAETQPFLLRLPTVSPNEATNALLNLHAAHYPERREFILPDGEVINELAAVIPSYPASTDTGDFIVGTERPIMVGSDGRGGSLISNAPEMLDAYRGLIANAHSQTAPCPANPDNLRLTSNFAAEIPLLRPYVREINGNPILLTQGVGNGVHICGYLK